MALGNLPNVQVADDATQRAIQAITERANQLSQIPLMDGLKLEKISLKSGTNTVNHKLGRVFTGYQVWRKDKQSDIWDVRSANEDKALTLFCSADVTVDLWVF